MTETLHNPNPSDLAYVPFVSVDNMMRNVRAIGAETFMRGIAEYIEQDFRRWESFDKKPRIPAHAPQGVIELMPASDDEYFGFKYVNGHPGNTRTGMQTVTGFGVLSRMSTGYPVLFTEMTILTALRTAANSALAAKYLAPKNSKTMAIIGNGAQSDFQCLAFKDMLGITDIRAYDIEPAASLRLARNLAHSGLNVTICKTPEDAIEGAEIITTVTADKRYATILTDNMVGSGVHINAIGGDCPGKTELHKDILLRSDIFVELPEQTREEGELQQLDADHPVTELWQVYAGHAEGRTSDTQITLFDSVGFAIEDFSALRYVNDMLPSTGHFEKLDLLADPDDPRDLYGMVLRSDASNGDDRAA
ncbi:ornithine cyclodeaminase [Labrenzia sp. R4_2]|uniref:ornithine cyclodeaminase n=1 Tax=Labrenzia sp. R4_2 TaxID=2821107 RepID=UPI001ADB8E3B|nr:ornithine cyclodeaminase [Labrenzia sp. R4_2]MBO9422042.1 ornithine cyclodeaminase [Labrenzia sp. R4_2]